ncbi:unnamed protein product [Blepharisma stoltei]|uniref:UBA domain-containing protein n=1 Tax=Blepharisma stoltei TaxID=1481888 RepID=A0AAU9J4J2_9CILI|nr:unnamed protein product [Blepharisma stoltei]
MEAFPKGQKPSKAASISDWRFSIGAEKPKKIADINKFYYDSSEEEDEMRELDAIEMLMIDEGILMELGYEEEKAKMALNACGGNLEKALVFLRLFEDDEFCDEEIDKNWEEDGSWREELSEENEELEMAVKLLAGLHWEVLDYGETILTTHSVRAIEIEIMAGKTEIPTKTLTKRPKDIQTETSTEISAKSSKAASTKILTGFSKMPIKLNKIPTASSTDIPIEIQQRHQHKPQEKIKKGT